MEGVSMSWFDSDADFASYEMLYIDIIDLKDVKIESGDEDDGGGGRAGEPSMRDLEKIAAGLHDRFYFALAQVMSVTADEEAIEGRKAIRANFKLVGTLMETTLLNSLLLGIRNVPSSVAIECRIYDSETGKELGWFTDSREIKADEKTDGWFASGKVDRWYKLMDYWAERFAKHMSVLRGMIY